MASDLDELLTTDEPPEAFIALFEAVEDLLMGETESLVIQGLTYGDKMLCYCMAKLRVLGTAVWHSQLIRIVSVIFRLVSPGGFQSSRQIGADELLSCILVDNRSGTAYLAWLSILSRFLISDLGLLSSLNTDNQCQISLMRVAVAFCVLNGCIRKAAPESMADLSDSCVSLEQLIVTAICKHDQSIVVFPLLLITSHYMGLESDLQDQRRLNAALTFAYSLFPIDAVDSDSLALIDGPNVLQAGVELEEWRSLLLSYPIAWHGDERRKLHISCLMRDVLLTDFVFSQTSKSATGHFSICFGPCDIPTATFPSTDFLVSVIRKLLMPIIDVLNSQLGNMILTWLIRQDVFMTLADAGVSTIPFDQSRISTLKNIPNMQRLGASSHPAIVFFFLSLSSVYKQCQDKYVLHRLNALLISFLRSTASSQVEAFHLFRAITDDVWQVMGAEIPVSLTNIAPDLPMALRLYLFMQDIDSNNKIGLTVSPIVGRIFCMPWQFFFLKLRSAHIFVHVYLSLMAESSETKHLRVMAIEYLEAELVTNQEDDMIQSNMFVRRIYQFLAQGDALCWKVLGKCFSAGDTKKAFDDFLVLTRESPDRTWRINALVKELESDASLTESRHNSNGLAMDSVAVASAIIPQVKTEAPEDEAVNITANQKGKSKRRAEDALQSVPRKKGKKVAVVEAPQIKAEDSVEEQSGVDDLDINTCVWYPLFLKKQSSVVEIRNADVEEACNSFESMILTGSSSLNINRYFKSMLLRVYPSEDKTILDILIVKKMLMHTWFVSLVIYSLPLTKSQYKLKKQLANVNQNVEQDENMPLYQRRLAPFYSIVPMFADTPSKLNSSNLDEDKSLSTKMEILKCLEKRIVTEYNSTLSDTLRKSHHAFGLFIDCLNSSSDKLLGTYLTELCERMRQCGANTDSTLNLGSVKTYEILILSIMNERKKIKISKIPSMIAEIFLFGECVNSGVSMRHQKFMPQYPECLEPIIIEYFCEFPKNEREKRSDVLRCIILGTELPKSQWEKDPRFRCIESMFSNSLISCPPETMFYVWLSPLVDAILENGSKATTIAHKLFHIMLSRSHLYQQVFLRQSNVEGKKYGAQNVNDAKKPTFNITRNWMNLLIDSQGRANLSNLYDVWHSSWRSSISHSGLFNCISNCDLNKSAQLDRFLSKEVLVLLQKEDQQIKQLLDMFIKSEEGISKMVVFKFSLLDPKLSKGIQKKLLSAIEDITSDMFGDETINAVQGTQSPSSLGNLCYTFRLWLDWGIEIPFLCMSSPMIVYSFLQLLPRVSTEKCVSMLSVFSCLYNELIKSAKETKLSKDSKVPLTTQAKSIVVTHRSVWQAVAPQVLSRFSDTQFEEAFVAACDSLMEAAAALGITGIPEHIAKIAAGGLSQAYIRNDEAQIKGLVAFLKRVVLKYPTKSICESIYVLLMSCLSSWKFDIAPRQLELFVLIPVLLKESKCDMMSSIIVKVVELLSLDKSKRPRELLLDILETCCEYKVNIGELLCCLPNVVETLVVSETHFYRRSIDILKRLREFTIDADESATRNAQSDKKATFESSWLKHSQETSGRIKRRLAMDRKAFDMSVSEKLNAVFRTVQMLGVKAHLASARSELGIQ